MRKYDLRLVQSEKIEISVQALGVRDEWRGKLYVKYAKQNRFSQLGVRDSFKMFAHVTVNGRRPWRIRRNIR